jgi:hypothetical protein
MMLSVPFLTCRVLMRPLWAQVRLHTSGGRNDKHTLIELVADTRSLICSATFKDAVSLLQVNFGDRLQHIKNTRLKPVAAWCHRALMRMLDRESYFYLW